MIELYDPVREVFRAVLSTWPDGDVYWEEDTVKSKDRPLIVCLLGVDRHPQEPSRLSASLTVRLYVKAGQSFSDYLPGLNNLILNGDYLVADRRVFVRDQAAQGFQQGEVPGYRPIQLQYTGTATFPVSGG